MMRLELTHKVVRLVQVSRVEYQDQSEVVRMVKR
jgi:hypothetical protein